MFGLAWWHWLLLLLAIAALVAAMNLLAHRRR